MHTELCACFLLCLKRIWASLLRPFFGEQREQRVDYERREDAQQGSAGLAGHLSQGLCPRRTARQRLRRSGCDRLSRRAQHCCRGPDPRKSSCKSGRCCQKSTLAGEVAIGQRLRDFSSHFYGVDHPVAQLPTHLPATKRWAVTAAKRASGPLCAADAL